MYDCYSCNDALSFFSRIHTATNMAQLSFMICKILLLFMFPEHDIIWLDFSKSTEIQLYLWTRSSKVALFHFKEQWSCFIIDVAKFTTLSIISSFIHLPSFHTGIQRQNCAWKKKDSLITSYQKGSSCTFNTVYHQWNNWCY